MAPPSVNEPPLLGPNNLGFNQNFGRQPDAVATTTTTTELPPELTLAQASTQNYWLEASNNDEPADDTTLNNETWHRQPEVASNRANTCFDSEDFECSLRGRCDSRSGKCSCFAGFSGPQCAKGEYCNWQCKFASRLEFELNDSSASSLFNLHVSRRPLTKPPRPTRPIIIHKQLV